MSNETRLKRLKHAVWVMERTPKETLRMDNWVIPKYHKEPVENMPDNFIKFDCRTAACFLGTLGFDKTCRKEGLKTCIRSREVMYGDCAGPDAAGAYFGITEMEAEALTYPDEYAEWDADKESGAGIKPKHVVTKLKNLIKKYEKRK